MRRQPPLLIGVLCAVFALGTVIPCAADDSAQTAAVPRPIARTVLALYDSAEVTSPRYSDVHALAEMPLNHLGLIVRYHDIQMGWPPVGTLRNVRGVLTWFEDDSMRDPHGYLRWIEQLSQHRIPLVVIGSLGAFRDDHGTPVPFDAINRALAGLGWRYDGGWHTTTYGTRYVIRDPRLIEFERPLPRVVPPYARVKAIARDAKTALRVTADGRPSTESDLVIVGPRGAYVALGYAYFAHRVLNREFRNWYLNPFEFFREAFDTDEVPKPDTTTLSGRRIYYSHIDGDGWRNLTQIEPHRTRYVIAGRVVLEELIRPFPDLPVTVGVIVGDIDPAWHGTVESLTVAKDLYGLSQVEPAIHTYSHPFDWGFFEQASNVARERQYSTQPLSGASGSDLLHHAVQGKPRSYNTQAFSLTTEIDKAAAFLQDLLPHDKRVSLVQWTGDTKPFERAVSHARRSGLANINGGETRFDREYSSAAWVSPLGFRLGDQLQVYASNSNENTYTDLWRDRFFGFSFLARTVRNTGSPRRLKPFNLYYHMYSGERLSSLNAVRANLAYARSLQLAPIETSLFSRIVEGFFTTVFEQVGTRAWRVLNRGDLQTIRFDHGTFSGVDWERSRGVIGQRHELGNLFVALDEAESTPVVALKPTESASGEPSERVPYLVESRWHVSHVRRQSTIVRFTTHGYGPGDSTWHWPFGDSADVRWHSRSGRSGQFVAKKAASGLLSLHLPQLTKEPVEVTISPSEAAVVAH